MGEFDRLLDLAAGQRRRAEQAQERRGQRAGQPAREAVPEGTGRRARRAPAAENERLGRIQQLIECDE